MALKIGAGPKENFSVGVRKCCLVVTDGCFLLKSWWDGGNITHLAIGVKDLFLKKSKLPFVFSATFSLGNLVTGLNLQPSV